MKTQTNQRESRAARMAIVRNLERLHPDMVVFTEPFQIQSPWPETQEREIAACIRVKEELQAAGVPVKVILTKAGAYVLRAKAGLQTNLDNYKSEIKSTVMRRRACFGAKKGAAKRA